MPPADAPMTTSWESAAATATLRDVRPDSVERCALGRNALHHHPHWVNRHDLLRGTAVGRLERPKRYLCPASSRRPTITLARPRRHGEELVPSGEPGGSRLSIERVANPVGSRRPIGIPRSAFGSLNTAPHAWTQSKIGLTRLSIICIPEMPRFHPLRAHRHGLCLPSGPLSSDGPSPSEPDPTNDPAPSRVVRHLDRRHPVDPTPPGR
jgi:hypothetical protein